MSFRCLIPLGALLLGDLLAFICTFLLVSLGIDNVVSIGLVIASAIPLAFFLGKKVGRSRSSRAMNPWDLKLGCALYVVLLNLTPSGDLAFLLAAALMIGKVAAFVYAFSKEDRSFFIKAIP